MPMTPREAIKLIRKNGGKFLRHGDRHDIYLMPNGKEISIPRHKKDLSAGVENEVKKKLGLK